MDCRPETSGWAWGTKGTRTDESVYSSKDVDHERSRSLNGSVASPLSFDEPFLDPLLYSVCPDPGILPVAYRRETDTRPGSPTEDRTDEERRTDTDPSSPPGRRGYRDGSSGIVRNPHKRLLKGNPGGSSRKGPHSGNPESLPTEEGGVNRRPPAELLKGGTPLRPSSTSVSLSLGVPRHSSLSGLPPTLSVRELPSFTYVREGRGPITR